MKSSQSSSLNEITHKWKHVTLASTCEIGLEVLRQQYAGEALVLSPLDEPKMWPFGFTFGS